ncbi:MAG TPA: glycosyltransferase family 4 protein [Candidatus Limnocylindrales bacterium]|jgi:glycosyltransferase involved in cell wall biosynthesis
MRIALLAPTYERVPPATYGGTEQIVAVLADELVARGHAVTLFATGDSDTAAHLRSITPRPFRYGDPDGPMHAEYVHLANAQAAFLAAADGEFDIVHNHAMVEGLALAAFSTTPVLTTCHNPYAPETEPIWAAYPWFHHALSWAGDATFPEHGRLPPIHHGIDVASFPFSDRGDGYLVFLGRFSPAKGAATAIEAARRSGRKLLLAGKIDRHDEAHFTSEIQPRIDGDHVRYVGEVDADAKRRLLAGADAVLFPIDWDEPFGLVVVEALASGTPVIGFRRASVPELVEDGVTGFVVADEDGMVDAIERLGSIDRRACRRDAERRFTVRRMTDDYERTYARVAASQPTRPIRAREESLA